MQHWAPALLGHTFNIQYKPTAQFRNADGLSRLSAGPDPDFNVAIADDTLFIRDTRLKAVSQVFSVSMDKVPLRAPEITRATASDPILSKLYRYTMEGWPPFKRDPELQACSACNTELTTENGCVMWGLRGVVPPRYDNVLKLLHDTHSGQTKMKVLARSCVWWPTMDKQTEVTSASCQTCATFSDQKPPVSLHQWEIPKEPWYHLYADFMEFHWKNLLLILDAFRKWPEVWPIPSTKALATIDAFEDILAAQGLPVQLATDHYGQFTYQFTGMTFKELLDRCGIRHILPPLYLPKLNGQAENLLQALKAFLRWQKEGQSP